MALALAWSERADRFFLRRHGESLIWNRLTRDGRHSLTFLALKEAANSMDCLNAAASASAFLCRAQYLLHGQ